MKISFAFQFLSNIRRNFSCRLIFSGPSKFTWIFSTFDFLNSLRDFALSDVTFWFSEYKKKTYSIPSIYGNKLVRAWLVIIRIHRENKKNVAW